MTGRAAEGEPRSDSEDNQSAKALHSSQRSEDDAKQTIDLQDILLETQPLSFLKCLLHRIEQWVDEIQETAPVDVPILIYFLTSVRPMTFMEKIMQDRDQTSSRRANNEENHQKRDFIQNMIEMTENNFASYRNIHVFSTGIDIDRLQMLRRQSMLMEEPEIARPKAEGSKT